MSLESEALELFEAQFDEIVDELEIDDEEPSDENEEDTRNSFHETNELKTVRRSTRSLNSLEDKEGEHVVDETIKKRSSRLRDNPELAAKHKAFLAKVNGSSSDSASKMELSCSNLSSVGMKRRSNIQMSSSSVLETKRRRSARNSASTIGESRNDSYCWNCHKRGDVLPCAICPRVFHLKCITLETRCSSNEDWVCPECILIMTAENMETRSRAMRLLSVDQLCNLLKHVLTRLRGISSVEPFTKAVDSIDFPLYKDYISCPMDLHLLETNVKKKQYGSTEAFLADVKWILHNCIVFNTTSSRLSVVAKQIVRVAKVEMQEIENCPDCYSNALKDPSSWFVSVCRIPHLLVWAKLKGFPFWPGKAMRVDSKGSVDVRFFGAHDRAWIPLKDVYLYSKEAPVTTSSLKNKKRGGSLEACVNEVNVYIDRIIEKFGVFETASFKTPLDPRSEEEQIRVLYPKYTLPFDLSPNVGRSRSFSVSESEQSQPTTPRRDEEDENEEEKKLSSHGAPKKDGGGANNVVVNEDPEDDIKLQLELEEDEEIDDDEPPSLIGKETLKIKDTDRVAASPPCEVSSTTQQNENARRVEKERKELKRREHDDEDEIGEEKKEKKENEKQKEEEEEKDNNEELKILIESYETEKSNSSTTVDDKKDKNKVEEIVEEIDDVEPEEERDKEDTNISKRETEVTQDEIRIVAEPTENGKSTIGNENEENENEEEEDDEIDDVEPDIVEDVMTIEEEINDVEEEEEEEIEEKECVKRNEKEGSCDFENNTMKTLSKDQNEIESFNESLTHKVPPHSSFLETDKKMTDIGLGSDISVTVVQKKKNGGGKYTPRISVKKESELCSKESFSKDVVHVTKAKKFLEEEKRSDSRNDEKAPPDPVVTISKVQSLATKGPVKRGGLVTSRLSYPSRSLLRPMVSSLYSPLASMPSLHPRPPGNLILPPHAPHSLPPSSQTPTSIGPVSEQLTRISGKLVDFMRSSIEDLFREMSHGGSPEATIKTLQLEMEKMQWRHQTEMAEVRHTTELKFQELQHAMEGDKAKALNDLKKSCELDKQRCVNDAKKKQWCANCGKEAIFYCCWNTSYCDYPCQQSHWPNHMSTCAQNQSSNEEENSDHPPSMDPNGTSHFLSSHTNNNSTGLPPRSHVNGIMVPPRGIQNLMIAPPHMMQNPMMVPFGPGGLNPRLMNQMASMRFCPPPPPRGPLHPHMRFPGTYFL